MPPLQFLFLGTATSTGLPLTPCLTLSHDYGPNFQKHVPHPSTPKGTAPAGHYDPEGPWPRNVKCACCRSAVDPAVPEGWKNKRGNTSGIVRRRGVDGRWRNILVDCGKTFLEQARRQFPKWDVKTIDAVLLSHGHADAFFGLDDLREWCIRQGYAIPIYLNQATMDTVTEAFPYLVDKTKASGGGDVPSLQWHVIDDFESFEVCGIPIKSYPVYHGVYFTDPAAKKSSSTPGAGPSETKAKPYTPQPFICLAFMFDDKVFYMADVSEVPETTWDRLLNTDKPSQLTEVIASNGKSHPGAPPTPIDTPPRGSSPSDALAAVSISSSALDSTPKPLPVFIVDALWPLQAHLSHFSFAQALQTTLRLKPEMTYLLGSVHPTTHYMWEEACRSLVGQEGQRPDHPDYDNSKWLMDKLRNHKEFSGPQGLYERFKEWHGRVEPAWDGLLLEVDDTVREVEVGKWQVR